jgi:hexosaminidase
LAIGGYLPLEKAYSFEPIPDALSADERKRILGGQAQLWTEYMLDERHVEYMAFPRLTALAEALWTPKSERFFDDFKRRLLKHLIRLRGMDINFHNPS